MTGRWRKPLWEWRHGDAVRILEASNQPATGLLRQNLQLNPLARLRHVGRSLRAHHRPAYVRDRRTRTQKPHVHVSDRERALGKDDLEAFADFALNLRATPPPPTDQVHRISVFGEQVGVGPCVVLIPCGCLRCLHLANRGFVLLLSRGRDGESRRHQPYYEPHSDAKLLHERTFRGIIFVQLTSPSRLGTRPTLSSEPQSFCAKTRAGLATNADLRSTYLIINSCIGFSPMISRTSVRFVIN